MSEINLEAIYFVEKNAKDLYCNGIEILLKLLSNIIKEPNNVKYRKFKATNKIIEQKLLPLDGIKELLLSIGFVFNDNEYILPSNILIRRIKNYKDFLEERRGIILRKITEESEVVSNLDSKNLTADNVPHEIERKKSIDIVASRPYKERTSYARFVSTTNNFLRSIEDSSDHVTQYEDENLLEIGKKIIPLEQITAEAEKSLNEIRKLIKAGKYEHAEPCIKDLILFELVNWFHNDFFEWVNKVSCKVCGNEISNCNMSIQNYVRVEIGWCCNMESRFSRYNDIAQLLKSRKGRCGEYANCFTFFCRCLDYDARHVVATFDHVWTEVYSEAQKRWIHIDPSDNVVDAPLMYQHGWNRKIDYVMAYSRDDIQDVTWRYTNNHKETLKLRKACREDELLQTILLLRKKRQMNLSDTRINYLNQKYLNELVELTKQREPTENEKKGRSSGSLTWRQERGEQHLNNFYIFKAVAEENENKNFNLRFSCVKNVYERFVKVNSVDKTINSYKDFNSTTFTVKNMFRKIEKDWKITYLARNENCLTGEIVWKFDFSEVKLKIKDYQLKFDTKTFETGKIDVHVSDLLGTEQIKDGSGLIIKVSLSGGNGDVAWQHAQLFRQSLNSYDYPFVLNITFH